LSIADCLFTIAVFGNGGVAIGNQPSKIGNLTLVTVFHSPTIR